MSNWPLISSYFSKESFEYEKKTIFNGSGLYSGHKLMVSKPDDYQTLPHLFDRYTLFNLNNTYSLISNICPHRQALLLEGSGNTKNISCKLHCWTFKNSGELKGTPHFKEKQDKDLENLNLYEWEGLLFKDKAPIIDLKAAGVDHLVNFENYHFGGIETEHYQFNWKTFVEIYLENYHVFSMHPGLKKFVSPSDLEWHFGENYSIQKVGIGKDLNNAGTEKYKKWQKAVLSENDSNQLRYGAIWMYIYLNIMVEWYPNILVVSTIYPTSETNCVNHVEFYYPNELYDKNKEYFEHQKDAYMETAVEDNEACLLLESGRRALYLSGEEKYGPVDSFLEAGVQHFYDWYQNKINS